MARIDTTGLDALISEMQKMGETSGAIAEAMVNAAVIEIRDCWKEAIEKHELIDTGAMLDSIGFPEPVHNIGGMLYRDVYPQGKDESGTRNAEKAFILNYGSSRIRPTHFVDEADKASENRVVSRLTDMWADYIESGGKVPRVSDTGGFIHHN